MHYGVNPELGTLERCRAKPENVGRFGCKHAEHHNLDYSDEIIKRFNEEALDKHFMSLSSTSKTLTEDTREITSNSIFSHPNGVAVSQQELSEISGKVADAFPSESFKIIRDFSEHIDGIITRQVAITSREAKRAHEKVLAFLKSDNPVAERTREFLGDEVDLSDFSAIITKSPRSMCEAFKFESGKNPVSRVIMTSVSNDMTKKRYTASVVFFGGRCCYCNVVMTKTPGDTQASGEHITPVNPENPKHPRGATRYGNMALACVGCNKERGNTELNEWLSNTERFPEAQKKMAMARIQAFRNYALYEEYTPEQNLEISKSIAKAVVYTKQFERGENGKYDHNATEHIRDWIKIEQHDLAERLKDI